MPMTTVTYGTYRCTVDASETVSNPKTPNTARKPSVIAAVAATARPTALGTLVPVPRTTNAR